MQKINSAPKSMNAATPFPKGLATIALLKAHYDSGSDHIDMIIPFVMDSIRIVDGTSFTADAIRDDLMSRYDLEIPSNTLRTAIERLKKRKLVRREGGRYILLEQITDTDLEQIKEDALIEQNELATAFRTFAKTENLPLTEDAALNLLGGFVCSRSCI
ncbi:MAG: hypothetical protein R8K53_06970 [Mariprofundaceae bacterium]